MTAVVVASDEGLSAFAQAGGVRVCLQGESALASVPTLYEIEKLFIVT